MNNWTLLLFISIESGSKAGGGPTIIEGFASEKLCDAAGRQIEQTVPYGYSVEYQCIQIDKGLMGESTQNTR